MRISTVAILLITTLTSTALAEPDLQLAEMQYNAGMANLLQARGDDPSRPLLRIRGDESDTVVDGPVLMQAKTVPRKARKVKKAGTS